MASSCNSNANEVPPHLTHWLVVGPTTWARGPSRDEAMKALRRQGRLGRRPTLVVYRVEPDVFIDGYGRICFISRADGLASYQLVEGP